MNNNKRIMIIFEGRETAGKSGSIRRITKHLNPRGVQIVALPKPSIEEQNQWYFERYIQQFPKTGEMVFLDRSWYNRAIVEPLNSYCTKEQYSVFLEQVNNFEYMMSEANIILIKIYMSISKSEQKKRFAELEKNPLKNWKMKGMETQSQKLWNTYTKYKDKMFENSIKSNRPWKIIEADKKTQARTMVIEYLLDQIPYDKNIEV